MLIAFSMVYSAFQVDSMLSLIHTLSCVDTAPVFFSCKLESPQYELVFMVKYATHALCFLWSIIWKAFTKLCETGKRNYILSQLFCFPAHFCCYTWERNKRVLSSRLASWDVCISMGKLPKSEVFQRPTDLSPFPDSKTPLCSLWQTVAPAVLKQLWRGFRVMPLEEILTIDWISKAKSLRSCPAKWLLPFFPSPSPSLSFFPAGLLCLV